MKAQAVNPVLNVSNIQESFEWFKKLGWEISLEWGDPVGFGGVCSGEVQIFLCEDGQGGRGKGTNATTFGSAGDEQADKGVWMSLWIDDVDAAYEQCKKHNIEITWKPTDMPWGVREMHIRHPDGHVFRVSRSINS
jgi:catechol 2,3-dioxygenase-like lactoylglutathione lyase family enzyme